MDEDRSERRPVRTSGIETYQVPWEQSMGDGARVGHMAVFTLATKELVEFAFQHEIRLHDQWLPVARFWWNEDHMVLDLYKKGTEEIERSERWGEDFETVGDAYDAALAEVYDDDAWTERIRRYEHGW